MQNKLVFYNNAGGGDAWFGLTLSELDSLSWSDGKILPPGSWYDIRIDSKGICFQFMNIRGTNEYRWKDQACDESSRYVCEYEGILQEENYNISHIL